MEIKSFDPTQQQINNELLITVNFMRPISLVIYKHNIADVQFIQSICSCEYFKIHETSSVFSCFEAPRRHVSKWLLALNSEMCPLSVFRYVHSSLILKICKTEISMLFDRKRRMYRISLWWYRDSNKFLFRCALIWSILSRGIRVWT